MAKYDEKKLGLVGDNTKDEQLIIDLLSWMHQSKADYTNTFFFNEKLYPKKLNL